MTAIVTRMAGSVVANRPPGSTTNTNRRQLADAIANLREEIDAGQRRGMLTDKLE